MPSGASYNPSETVTAINNTIVQNLNFLYTGAITSGEAIYIQSVAQDYYSFGSIEFDNVVVYSSQQMVGGALGTVPTNIDFIGVAILRFDEITFNSCTIAYFGTGFRHFLTALKSHNLICNGCQITECNIGLYEPDGSGLNLRTTLNSCKFIMDPLYGIYGQAFMLVVNNGEFETTGTRSGDSSSIVEGIGSLVVNGGVFTVANRGITYGTTVYPEAYNLVVIAAAFNLRQ